MARRKKKSLGLYDEFISEYNRLKLTKLEPYVLADIIVQANRRRKREAAKWKHEATAYRKQFIRERNAHARTQNNFRKLLDDCERREQTLRSREKDYMKWHNRVEELAERGLQRCNIWQSDNGEGGDADEPLAIIYVSDVPSEGETVFICLDELEDNREYRVVKRIFGINVPHHSGCWNLYVEPKRHGFID